MTIDFLDAYYSDIDNITIKSHIYKISIFIQRLNMKNNDETILEILQGHKTTRWPTARMVKIFIATSKSGKLLFFFSYFVNSILAYILAAYNKKYSKCESFSLTMDELLIRLNNPVKVFSQAINHLFLWCCL